MANLLFNVTRQWYDKYRSGEKREEYREIKQHWEARLFDRNEFMHSFEPKEFDTVTIRRGYSPKPETPDLIFRWVETTWGYAKDGIGRELMGDKLVYVVTMEDIQ